MPKERIHQIQDEQEADTIKSGTLLFPLMAEHVTMPLLHLSPIAVAFPSQGRRKHPRDGS